MQDQLSVVVDDSGVTHPVLLSHQGTTVALYLNGERRIRYLVLDAAKASQGADSEAWTAPQDLPFPRELGTIGFAAAGMDLLPDVELGLPGLLRPPGTVASDRLDAWLSGTGRLTSAAPFQAFSDGTHLFVFRLSIDEADPLALYKSSSGAAGSLTTTRVVGTALVDGALLCDRFVLVGDALQRVREVRYRRSRRRDRPGSVRDTLGPTDMDERPFFEPTLVVAFVQRVAPSGFGVLQLPTEVPGLRRWHIFVTDVAGGGVSIWDVPVGSDGLFDLVGSTRWTSPDPHYASAMSESQPGTCPYTGAPLVPKRGASDRGGVAVMFSGLGGAYLGSPATPGLGLADGSFTLEALVKIEAAPLKTSATLFYLPGKDPLVPGKVLAAIEVDDVQPVPRLRLGDKSTQLPQGVWVHLAIVFDAAEHLIRALVDGSEQVTAPMPSHPLAGATILALGAGTVPLTVDYVRAWTYARSAADVQRDRALRLTGIEHGLAALWSFDEIRGDTLLALGPSGQHGRLWGSALRVVSDAPLADPPGLRLRRLMLADRSVTGGLAAVLYHQQEDRRQGVDGEARPTLQDARVMLACSTRGPSPFPELPVGVRIWLSADTWSGRATWEDLSGLGNHATPTVDRRGPTPCLTTLHDGRTVPLMHFESDAELAFPDVLDLDNDMTLFIVERHRGAEARCVLQSADEVWRIVVEDDRYTCAWGQQRFVGEERRHGELMVHRVRRRQGKGSYLVNGRVVPAEGTGASEAAVETAIGSLRLGSHTGNHEADIGTVLAWNRALSAADCQRVEDWLADRYGIMEVWENDDDLPDGLTLHLDAAFPEAVPGATTQTWSNRVPGGQAPTVPAGRVAPVWREEVLPGGHKVGCVRFGSGVGLELPVTLTGPPFTILVVDRYSGPRRNALLTGPSGGWTIGRKFGQTGLQINGSIAAKGTAPGDAFEVTIVRATASGDRVWLDGEGQDLAGVANAPGKLVMGDTITYPQGASDADAIAVMVWGRALTDEEVAEVQAWWTTRLRPSQPSRSAGEKQYVAVLDLGVGRDGRLAELPALVQLPPLITSTAMSTENLVEQIQRKEQELARLRDGKAELERQLSALLGGRQTLASLRPAQVAQMAAITELQRQLDAIGARSARTHTNGSVASWPQGYSGPPSNGFQRFTSLDLDAEVMMRVIYTDGTRDLYGPDATNKRNQGTGGMEAASIEVRHMDDASAQGWPMATAFASARGQLRGQKQYAEAILASVEAAIAAATPGTSGADEQTIRQNLAATQRDLDTATKDLEFLRSAKISSITPPVMPLIGVDTMGLSVAGALLGAAWTDAQPVLHRAADARVDLYFQGQDNQQLYALGYETQAQRSSLRLDASGGAMVVHARSTAPAASALRVVVRTASDPSVDRCDVDVVVNATDVSETWRNVPRDARLFAAVLSGEAVRGLVVRVGVVQKVDADTGGQTLVTVRGLFPAGVGPGSTLIIGGARVVVKSVDLTRTCATLQTPASTPASTPGQGDLVSWWYVYDASQVCPSAPGVSFRSGSRLVVVTPMDGATKVGDGENAVMRGAVGGRWVADAPGEAPSFAGTGVLVAPDGDTARMTPNPARNCTVEAWLFADTPTTASPQRLLSFGPGNYTTGIELTPTNSAIASSQELSVERLRPATWEELTVELWVRPTTSTGDLIVLANNAMRLSLTATGLSLVDGARGSAAALDLPCALPRGVWSHVAFTRSKAGGRLRVILNGDVLWESATSAAVRSIAGPPVFLRNYAGDVAELRVWSRARAPHEVRRDRNALIDAGAAGLDSLWRLRRDTFCDVHPAAAAAQGARVVTPTDLKIGPVASLSVAAWVGTTMRKSSTPALSPGRWHHVAAIFEQSWSVRFEGDGEIDAGASPALDQTGDLTLELDVRLEAGRAHGLVAMGDHRTSARQPGGARAPGIPYDVSVAVDGALVFAYEDAGGERQELRSPAGRVAFGVVARLAVTRRRGTSNEEKTENYMFGATQRTLVTAVEVRRWDEIVLYVDGQPVASAQFDAASPCGGAGRLKLGRSALAVPGGVGMRGELCQVRLWSEARAPTEIGQPPAQNARGLIAWWRLDEGQGTFASDSQHVADGRILRGAWAVTPDAGGSSFELLVDGTRVASDPSTRVDAPAGEAVLGGRWQGGSVLDGYRGVLEEVRVWHEARTGEQIQNNMFTRVAPDAARLAAAWTFRDFNGAGEYVDAGPLALSLTPRPDAKSCVPVLSTAPIGRDAPLVRPATAGVRTHLHEPTEARPAVVTYADLQTDRRGDPSGVLLTAYAVVQQGRLKLVTGFRVAELEHAWVGQVQMDPQVVGYIEGAPPVPGENLTEGPVSLQESYVGCSRVTFVESDSTTLTVSRERNRGFDTAFAAKATASLEVGTSMMAITAPLGVGVGVDIDASTGVTLGVGLGASMSASYGWIDGETRGATRSTSHNMSVGLTGRWESRAHRKNRAITARFVPVNRGFALVKSHTADVYALRVKHTGAVIQYRMLPSGDIPEDWNLIEFPINPLYTLQGCLDGRIGMDVNNTPVMAEPYENQTATSRGLSYFRPAEAYALKRRIDRATEQAAAAWRDVRTDPPGALGAGIGAAVSSAAMAVAPVLAPVMAAGSAVGGLIDALTASNDLPERMANRSLVNTYVWTATGGFFEESTQVAESWQEVAGGTYNFQGALSMNASLEFDVVGVGVGFEMNASVGGSLVLTRTRTLDAQRSFSLEIKLTPPGDTQRYKYEGENDQGELLPGVAAPGEIEPVYDAQYRPQDQPGKVDCYRFMTFLLEPDEQHHEDLFEKVVDPLWLAQSSDANAIALRGARQASRKPPAWRVFHRVTFVSRILPQVAVHGASSLVSHLREVDIASNYALVQRLEPRVRPAARDLPTLRAAVLEVLRSELPMLVEDLDAVVEVMAGYLGVNA